jgi:hypothetical protein
MTTAAQKSKTTRRVFLVSGQNINSFPLSDHPHAADDFLIDCERMGWPHLKVDQDYYVFAVARPAEGRR